jgi:hypothetical protein
MPRASFVRALKCTFSLGLVIPLFVSSSGRLREFPKQTIAIPEQVPKEIHLKGESDLVKYLQKMAYCDDEQRAVHKLFLPGIAINTIRWQWKRSIFYQIKIMDHGKNF